MSKTILIVLLVKTSKTILIVPLAISKKQKALLGFLLGGAGFLLTSLLLSSVSGRFLFLGSFRSLYFNLLEKKSSVIEVLQ
jgi:hypothetical protein